MTTYKQVPDEVKKQVATGIFWSFPYTHLSSSTAREGITKTGKIMAPRVAMAHDIVPFSGETVGDVNLFAYTYMFRAYHVSVSEYPEAKDMHHWRFYLPYGALPWSPQNSEGAVTALETMRKEVQERPICRVDFEAPEIRRGQLIKIEECLEIEAARQRKYKEMSDDERAIIAHPKPDLYCFRDGLQTILSPGILFGKPIQQHSHPFVPAEINLKRYLACLFTRGEVGETQAWISHIVDREIPVASIDALATFEDMVPRLPSFDAFRATGFHPREKFYDAIQKDKSLRDKVIAEVYAL